MPLQETLLYAQSCLAEGGPFTTLVAGLAAGLGLILLVWFLRVAIRSSQRRDDLRRIHDLLLEGSLGEAILLADKRSSDPVLDVVRTSIATIQATKSRVEAMERLDTEIENSFRLRSRALRVVGVGIILFAILLPGAIGFVGQVWARQQIAAAADAMAEISPGEVDAVWTDGESSLVYACPANTGAPATLALLVPTLIVGIWTLRYWGPGARKQARAASTRYIDMAARVLDPTHAVYAREQGTYVPEHAWDRSLLKGS